MKGDVNDTKRVFFGYTVVPKGCFETNQHASPSFPRIKKGDEIIYVPPFAAISSKDYLFLELKPA